jgi:hypothetical protein
VLDEINRCFALIPVCKLMQWQPSGGDAHRKNAPCSPPFPDNSSTNTIATPLYCGDIFMEFGHTNLECATHVK